MFGFLDNEIFDFDGDGKVSLGEKLIAYDMLMGDDYERNSDSNYDDEYDFDRDDSDNYDSDFDF